MEKINRILKSPAWTLSKTEEVLAALYVIAGLLAWIAGIHWFAWFLFAKGALDTVAAITLAIVENREETRPEEPDPEPSPSEILDRLDLSDKQSIVDLMFSVQVGTTSCRRAASEIQSRIPKQDP